MAITVYNKNECDVLLGRQTAWGTALLDNAAMTILDVESAFIDPDINIRTPQRSNSGSRAPQDFNIQADTYGTTPKISLSGDMKLADAAHFFYASIQGLTSEAAGTPFRKIFTFPATQPDFTAIASATSAGYIATIIEKEPIAGKSAKIRDAICTDLTLTCAPDAGDGRLQHKSTWIGRGAINQASTPAGAYTRTAQAFFPFHMLNAFTGATNPLIPLSFEIKIAQPKTKGISSDLVGQFKTYVIPEYEVTAKVVVLDDTYSRAVRAYWNDATPTAWVISWSTLVFDLMMVITSAPMVLGDQNAIEFNLRGVKSGATAALTVTLDDAVDRGWT